MIDSEEMLFVVDEQNQPLAPLPRRVVHDRSLWHRTTGVFVINKEGQILCQKRSIYKDQAPGKWEAYLGGHLSPDEEYLRNAAMETSEELGIPVSENELIFYKVVKVDKPTHRQFEGFYALFLDKDALFNFEKEEIEQLKWMDLRQVEEALVNKKDPAWVLKPSDEELLIWLKTLI